MFIKIGDRLINLNNMTDIAFNPDDEGLDAIAFYGVDRPAIRYTQGDDDYVQALAAYEFLCKGAMTFQATETDSPASGERDGDSIENVLVTFGEYGVRTMRFGSYEVFEIATGKGEGCFEDPAEARMFAWELGGKDISTAHPQAATEPTGYTVRGFAFATEGAFPSHEVISHDGRLIVYADKHRAPVIAQALNTETETLRADNARLQADLEAKQGQLMQYAADVTKAGQEVKKLRQRVEISENTMNRIMYKIGEARKLISTNEVVGADSELDDVREIITDYLVE